MGQPAGPGRFQVVTSPSLGEEGTVRGHLVHVDQIRHLLNGLHRLGRIEQDAPVGGGGRVLPAIAADRRVQRNEPGGPLHAVLLDVVRIETGVAGMVAAPVKGQGRGHGQEFIPGPGLAGMVAGRFDPRRLKRVQIGVQMGTDPAGTQAVPVAFPSAALKLFLVVRPVRRLAEAFMGIHVGRDVEQHALDDPTEKSAPSRRTSVGRRAGGEIWVKHLLPIACCSVCQSTV